MSPDELDEILFIVLTSAFVLSPALVLMPWIGLTKIEAVKRRLTRALLTFIATPLFAAGLFVVLKALCRSGGLDQSFSECGPIPVEVTEKYYIAAFTPVIFGAWGVIFSIYQEVKVSLTVSQVRKKP